MRGEVRGVVPPVPTFLRADGSLDGQAQAATVDRLAGAGVDGLLVLGSVGEGPVLGQRLEKFGLELSGAKTRIIPFSRYRQAGKMRFEFLGFEFRWGKDRKGQDHLKRRTARQKLRSALKRFTLHRRRQTRDGWGLAGGARISSTFRRRSICPYGFGRNGLPGCRSLGPTTPDMNNTRVSGRTTRTCRARSPSARPADGERCVLTDIRPAPYLTPGLETGV
jgi:hypothetical protein